MPYQKYTQCTSVSGYVPLQTAYFAALIALVPVLGAVLVIATSLWLIPILISLVVAAIAFCTWYLYHRLICLSPQQVCAIGVITDILHPNAITTVGKGGDNDATINVLLAPGPLDYNEDLLVYTAQVQGDLIKKQDLITNAGLGYASSGGDLQHLKGLHCEFEGDGIASLLALLSAILVFLIALLALTLLAPQLAPLILLLWFLIIALGAAGLFNDLVNPPVATGTDVQGNPGNLIVGNIVAVTGDWIYDGGHVGWNEIHAVHDCQIITPIAIDFNDPNKSWPSDIGGGLGLDTPDKVNQALAMWCSAISTAGGAIQGGSMTDPGNNWVVHPLVDGCKKSPVIV